MTYLKYFTVCTALFLFCQSLRAQQESQFTQYLFATQVINPAYIGSKELASVGLLARSQWINFEGAPRTGTLTYHMPLGRSYNAALGFSVLHDVIGPVNQTTITVDYAYNLFLNTGKRLSFGLKPGIKLFDLNLNKLNLEDDNDVFRNAEGSEVTPRMGAGIYYATPHFYAGLSVPHFLGSLSAKNSYRDAYDRAHYYLMMGYVMNVNSSLKFKPATLFKAVNGAPLQWDLSANFLYKEQFLLGASYRWSAAVSLIAGFQLMERIFMGVSYDYQTTDLEKYSKGSYELVFQFDLFGNSNCDCSLKKRFF